MSWLFDILREYPTLAIFLTIGIGFLVGKIKIGSFQLGSVTAVLLVGVIVGQLNISISGPIKMVFFMMFLFSIGYSVGPEFFRSLRGSGFKQVLFALCMSCFIFITILLAATLLSYSKGVAVGLFSGSETCSALIGVGSEAIARMGGDKTCIQKEINLIPICYAVTYIYGTLGTVIILGNLGPKLLGGLEKVKTQARELEEQLNISNDHVNPALESALRKIYYRVYEVQTDWFATAHTVREIEKHLLSHGIRIYIDRIWHNGAIIPPRYDCKIRLGDRLVVCGHNDQIIRVNNFFGEEISDPDLLSYHLERRGVVVAKKSFIGKSISELRKEKYMHGVVIRDAERKGKPLTIDLDTRFEKGDHLTIVGRQSQIITTADAIGYADKPTISSDLMFVGLAIFIGGLFGALSIWIGSIPVSFGTSGGSLIAGLVFGWLRSKRPTFGHISPGALWLMNNLGLNVFVAVVGIEAAPTFLSGLREIGPLFFVVGIVTTTLPLLFGLWLGHKVFRFNPAITLGCCAGTRTCTASLGAVQDTIGSTVPTVGYTVTYAVSNIMLVFWGLLMVLLM